MRMRLLMPARGCPLPRTPLATPRCTPLKPIWILSRGHDPQVILAIGHWRTRYHAGHLSRTWDQDTRNPITALHLTLRRTDSHNLHNTALRPAKLTSQPHSCKLQPCSLHRPNMLNNTLHLRLPHHPCTNRTFINIRHSKELTFSKHNLRSTHHLRPPMMPRLNSSAQAWNTHRKRRVTIAGTMCINPCRLLRMAISIRPHNRAILNWHLTSRHTSKYHLRRLHQLSRTMDTRRRWTCTHHVRRLWSQCTHLLATPVQPLRLVQSQPWNCLLCRLPCLRAVRLMHPRQHRLSHRTHTTPAKLLFQRPTSAVMAMSSVTGTRTSPYGKVPDLT